MNLEQSDSPARAVVAIIQQADSFLAIKRAAGVRAPGKICFPGGGIEADETETDALVREIKEELSVDIEPVKKVWQSVTPWGVEVNWYTAKLLSHEISIDPAEVEWCKWLSDHAIRSHPDLLESNRHFFEAWKQGKFEL